MTHEIENHINDNNIMVPVEIDNNLNDNNFMVPETDNNEEIYDKDEVFEEFNNCLEGDERLLFSAKDMEFIDS